MNETNISLPVRIMKMFIPVIAYCFFVCINFCARNPVVRSKPERTDNQKADGCRGIWFELNQKYEYANKNSVGLGTFTSDHIPKAVYCREVDKTFFVYGGTTDSTERHVLCMVV
jgi:hypothetical protein